MTDTTSTTAAAHTAQENGADGGKNRGAAQGYLAAGTAGAAAPQGAGYGAITDRAAG